MPVDAPRSERVAAAVAEVVGKQAAAGVDVINDGEMSKPSYATCIKDRLADRGTGNTFVYQVDRLQSRQACSATRGGPGARRPRAMRR